jgi:hypothetical protein
VKKLDVFFLFLGLRPSLTMEKIDANWLGRTSGCTERCGRTAIVCPGNVPLLAPRTGVTCTVVAEGTTKSIILSFH